MDLPLNPVEGPVLLLGTFPPATMMDLVQMLPPRRVTDMLIARFFEGKEPAWSKCRGIPACDTR